MTTPIVNDNKVHIVFTLNNERHDEYTKQFQRALAEEHELKHFQHLSASMAMLFSREGKESVLEDESPNPILLSDCLPGAMRMDGFSSCSAIAPWVARVREMLKTTNRTLYVLVADHPSNRADRKELWGDEGIVYHSMEEFQQTSDALVRPNPRGNVSEEYPTAV